MQYQKIIKAAAILLTIVLVTIIAKFGKPFLVPIVFAAFLSMLLLPFSLWLEKKGVNKAISAAMSILVLVAFFAGVIGFISWQVSDLAQDATKLEQQITGKYQQAQQYISEELGISQEKQKQFMEKQEESSGGKMSFVKGLLSGLGGLLTDTLLVLVYIFLFLYFRGHLKRFITRIVPNREEGKAVHVVDQAQQVTQKYLIGLSWMIVGLWIMYGIGFSIVGVKNAVFFAVLCGMLEIIPFVGNLVGNLLTILMALSQGGDKNIIIGIVITYGVVQFIQSYILEPLIVGSEVNINPLFTIAGLVAGEFVWGIPGMVLAIPLMGVTKIVFDHVDGLKPYGELIGEDKKAPNKFKKKIISLVNKITKGGNRKKSTATKNK